jgi:hypothetical protein
MLSILTLLSFLLIAMFTSHGTEVVQFSAQTQAGFFLLISGAIALAFVTVLVLRLSSVAVRNAPDGPPPRAFVIVAVVAQGAIWYVLLSAIVTDPDYVSTWIYLYFWMLFAWSVGLAFAVARAPIARWNFVCSPRRRWRVVAGVLLVLIVLAAFPIPIGTALGPIAASMLIVCLFMILISSILAMKRRWILLTGILACAAATLYWIPNRPIRLLHDANVWTENRSVDCPSDIGVPGILGRNRAFLCWYEKNKDEDGFATMILVAASGGGARAAAWTATVLSELDRQVPEFSDKLFAISAVSGGSLGAATFMGELLERERQPHCRPGPHGGLSSCAAQFLNSDVMGPLITEWFSGDLLSTTFGPLKWIFPNRGEVLERSWEDAWQRSYKSDLFSRSFTSLWPRRPWPALLLNTTMVNVGHVAVISNLHDAGAPPWQISLWFPSLRLSTAVHNSARFPVISPSGRMMWPVKADDQGKERFVWPFFDGKIVEGTNPKYWDTLVDGGYVDNYGTLALSTLIDGFEEAQCNLARQKLPNSREESCDALLETRRLVRYVLIQISSDTEAKGSCTAPLDPIETVGGASEHADALIPLMTLLNSRSVNGLSQAATLAKRVMKLYKDDDNARHSVGAYAANDPSFQHIYFHFPLGSRVEDPTEEERDKSKEIAEAPDAMTGVNTQTGTQIKFIMRPRAMITAKDPRPPLNWALSAVSRRAIVAQIPICGSTVTKQLASMLRIGLHRVAVEAVEDWRDCWSYNFDNEQRVVDGCTRVLARTDQNDTHRVRARDFRAMAYMMLKNYEEARDDYSALIEHNPKDAVPWVQRCTARVAIDENDLAVADCSEALRLDPSLTWAYIKRGHAYYAREKYREAIADYDTALRGKSDDAIAPLNNAVALYSRGLAKKKLGDDTGAAEDAARARDVQPNVPTFFGEQLP